MPDLSGAVDLSYAATAQRARRTERAVGLPPIDVQLACHEDPATGVRVPWVIGSPPVTAWTQMDETRRRRAIREELCGVCGLDTLGYRFAFLVVTPLGRPVALDHRNMTVPPMHRDCALWAARAVPTWSAATAREHTWLYVTRSYKVRAIDDVLVAFAAPATALEPIGPTP